MRGWLVYRQEDAEKNRAFVDWFLVEAKYIGMQLDLVYHHEISYGVTDKQLFITRKKESALPDFVIMRAIDIKLSKQFESLGVPTYNNSEVAEITNDKAKTYQLFATHGIPIIDTQFVAKADILQKTYTYPFVIKEVASRGGKEVYKIDSAHELKNIVDRLKGEHYTIQKLASPGKDLRVFVVGNQIIKAVLRESDTDFRANYTLGGRATIYDLSPAEEKIIHTILNIFPFDMVGIDFLFTEDNELLLNEIEDVVGCRTLTTLTDINIVSIYLNHILADLTRR